jgi:hypothetical protein
MVDPVLSVKIRKKRPSRFTFWMAHFLDESHNWIAAYFQTLKNSIKGKPSQWAKS